MLTPLRAVRYALQVGLPVVIINPNCCAVSINSNSFWCGPAELNLFLGPSRVTNSTTASGHTQSTCNAAKLQHNGHKFTKLRNFQCAGKKVADPMTINDCCLQVNRPKCDDVTLSRDFPDVARIMVHTNRNVTFASKPHFLDPEAAGIAQPITERVNVNISFGVGVLAHFSLPATLSSDCLLLFPERCRGVSLWGRW